LPAHQLASDQYAKGSHRSRCESAWSATRKPSRGTHAASLWHRKEAADYKIEGASGEGSIKSKTSLVRFLREEGSLHSPRPARRVRVHLPISLSFQRLLDLLGERGKDDYGSIDPTQYAFKTASEFVLASEYMLGLGIRSSPVVDSQGGIRITWRNASKQIKLVCPATSSDPIYIYESSPRGSTIYNKEVNHIKLAERLSWLTHGDESEQPSP
jgi:hypothetical protein